MGENLDRSCPNVDAAPGSRATGQEPREQAERLVEALNARDFETIARMPWLQADFQFLRLEETIDSDDQVVAVQRLSGRGRASGASLGVHLAVVFTIRAGRIVRAREYATRAEALEAVGLRE